MLLFQARSTLPPKPPTAPAVDEIIYKGFPFQRNITRADLEKILGKPASVNERTGKTPSVFHFKGLTVELIENSKIATIELTDNVWRFPAKLRIGSSRDEALKLLGKPDIETKSELTYGCYDCVFDDKIHLTLDGDKISRIKWDFYLN